MKLLAEAAHLAAAVSALAGMIPANALFPILATIKLEAAKGRLVLTATNMDCLANITLPAKVTKQGTVAIEAGRLSSFLEGLNGQVSIELEGQGAVAKCNKRIARLSILPPDEFPVITFDGAPTSFDLTGETVSALADMFFATGGREGTRPYLAGVHIFTRGKELVAEATTGMVAMRQSFKAGAKIPIESSIIIPRESLALLKKLFPEGCSIDVTDSKLKASDAAVEFISKLVSGPYPSLDGFIPKAAEALSIRCVASEMATAAERVAAIAGNDVHWVTLFPRGDHVLMTATDKADAEDVVAAECSGTIDQLTLSTQILGPLVAALGGARVNFSQNVPGAPVRIDPEDESKLGVIMPVRFRAVERVAA